MNKKLCNVCFFKLSTNKTKVCTRVTHNQSSQGVDSRVRFVMSEFRRLNPASQSVAAFFTLYSYTFFIM